MSTLIQFYDKDVIKNTLGVISLKPDKVVFVYDELLKDMNRFASLEKCYKRHFPDIVIEKHPVNIISMNDIYDVLVKVIEKNDDCMLELTGGSDLMIIAGYKAGSDKNVRLLYTDILTEKVIDINDDSVVTATEELSLADFVDARGACFIGTSHDEPEEEWFDRILEMCGIIFRSIKPWRETCAFLQTVMADTEPDYITVNSKLETNQKDGRKVSPDRRMIHAFERLGFIKNLYLTDRYISFEFASPQIKTYMTGYGVWLELYVYINAKKAGVFKDVKLGAMIDWDAYDGITIPENEIDVIFMDESMPVFVSCKLTDANTPALNELLIAKKRLGGWFSKSIIVTYGNRSIKGQGTYNRAKQYGIEVLDKDDILSDNFAERIVEAVRGHSPVDLKWEKV